MAQASHAFKALRAHGDTVWWVSSGDLWRQQGTGEPELLVEDHAGEDLAVGPNTACWTRYFQGYAVRCWHRGERLLWPVHYDSNGQTLRGVAIQDEMVYVTTPLAETQRAMGLVPVSERGAILRMRLP